jgi:hypothetical protein
MMRLVVILSCVWLACGKPAIPPSVEAAYQAERFAAEESGSTCKEAVAAVARVEAKWAARLQEYATRPISKGPTLVCEEGWK